tara:strand:- start:28 stop:630 length:603 start_codon:yes stop_codon:yes gene_type:complete
MAWELRDALKIIPAIAMAGALSACQPSQRLLLAGAGSTTGSISLASSGETIASGRPCAQGEERIFLAEVVDDFGLTIALCILPAPKRDESRIALRYSGEGGKRELSCIAKDCAGILKFSHYRRPRFTVLRLAWRDEEGLKRIVETFDGQDPEANPHHSVTFSWTTAAKIGTDIDARSFSAISHNQPLALLRLERFLESAD